MPQVTIRTGADADGREETLTEYLCDWADCPNIAVEVLGFSRELRTAIVFCAIHAAQIKARVDDRP
jgi:hypothetical protein